MSNSVYCCQSTSFGSESGVCLPIDDFSKESRLVSDAHQPHVICIFETNVLQLLQLSSSVTSSLIHCECELVPCFFSHTKHPSSVLSQCFSDWPTGLEDIHVHRFLCFFRVRIFNSFFFCQLLVRCGRLSWL